MKIFKKHWEIPIVLILSWWTVGPLFHSGFFSIHDDTQVVRVSQMAKALADGQFPVRWVADLGYGYGYPLFNFYSPLPYYIGGLFNLIGFDVLAATKIMMILGILLSGIFMYFLAKEFWGEIGGVVAALFYVYAPYHALDIYVRGAVGEFWAYAFIPLVFLGFYKIFEKSHDYIKRHAELGSASKGIPKQVRDDDKKRTTDFKWIVVASLGYAGVILSHNLTAMMVIPFLVTGLLGYWVIRLISKEKSWKMKLYPIPYTLYPIFLALGLSAFYWLPALWEMGSTNVSSQIGGGADFRDHFVCIQQLWDSPWGFGGSAPGCVTDGLSFKVGKLHILLSITAFLMVLWWGRKRKITSLFYCSIVLLLFSIFLMLEISRPIWEVIPLTAYIQYPWRFLIFTTFTASFLAGSIFWWLKNKIFKTFAFCLLIFILLFYNLKLFQPQKYLPVNAQDYVNEENVKWKTSKISDEYLPKGFPVPKNENQIVKEKIVALDKFSQISNLEIKSNRYNFNISGENENLILARVAFSPGWTVFVDGREKLFLVQNGQMFFATPKGQHRVEVVFKNTLVRTVGNMFSALSLVVLIGGVLYVRKKASVKD